MSKRDSNLPVMIGVIFSLLIHGAAGVALGGYQWAKPDEPARAEPPPPQDKPEPEPNEPEPRPRQPGEPALPDLAIAEMDIPGPREAGSPSELIVDVANIGDVPVEGVDVGILVDDQPQAVVHIDEPIAPGKVVQLSVPIQVDEPGRHEVTVVADATDQHEEPNEQNNVLSREFDFSNPDEIKVGDDNPEELALNWISYDDYQELIAPKGDFDQAAYQMTVDPTPEAQQTPLDPTPPAPQQPPTEVTVAPSEEPTPNEESPNESENEQPSEAVVEAPVEDGQVDEMVQPSPPIMPTAAAPPAEPQPVSPPQVTMETQTPPAPEAPTEAEPAETVGAPLLAMSAPLQREELALDADVPAAPNESPEVIESSADIEPTEATEPTEEEPAEAESGAPPETEPTETQEPSQTPPPSPQTPAQPPTPAPRAATAARTAPKESNAEPTAAPKDERESPPISRIGGVQVRPGRVIARQGIQINTVRPRFSAAALMTGVPHNPVLKIEFNKEGKVMRAEFIAKTGYPNWDGPVLNSAYRWTASGEGLKRVKDKLTIEVEIVLGR